MALQGDTGEFGMKCIVAPLLVLGLVLGLALGAEAKTKAKGQAKAAAPDGPRITFEETAFNAGDIPAGGKLSHDFVVKNTGTANLEITRVAPGCGCTVASFDKVIAPGQSGKITIEVQLYDEWAGHKINQSALVESNDPRARRTSLTVGANLLPKDAPEPEANP